MYRSQLNKGKYPQNNKNADEKLADLFKKEAIEFTSKVKEQNSTKKESPKDNEGARKRKPARRKIAS